MAPIRGSEESLVPTRGMLTNSTFEVTHLPARRLPAPQATEDETEEETAPRGVDCSWQPSQLSYWEEYKPIMRRLYIDEKKPLREVVEIMENDFGFKATQKVYKNRFRIWGWRKYIRLDPAADTRRVQDVISNTSQEDGAGGRLQGQKVRLANGQLVDVQRLQQHIMRKRRYKEAPLTCRINQPDVFHHTEAIFHSARSHTLRQYQGRLRNVEDTLEIFAADEPIIGRWLRFTEEIQGLLKQQNLSGAIVQMRRAPDEVAAMTKAEPTVLLSNLFMYILKVGNYTAVDPTESRHVKLVVKSLLQYAASLLVSGTPGAQTTRQMQAIVKGLATASESDLGEITSRSWLVILQSCAQIAGLDPSAAVAEGSLVKWIETGDQGEKDGLWFLEITQGIIDGTVARLEAAFGKHYFRCIDALQRKAYVIKYANTARRRDSRLDPRLEDLYLQILERGAKGAQRAEALNFLAESHRAHRELGLGEDYARSSLVTRND
ncbi:hypothetical protein DHEL01_v209758 [Diaporthe helianthi]|uniref:Clr5 domain-containing protein n=1 Tax=Diaporthe helianthi TaxID=158607 RepID=A0A2P5HNL8_DIAHE|nr:hypothetical protein DHEL01_v209758 [Diaporthe helianthi]